MKDFNEFREGVHEQLKQRVSELVLEVSEEVIEERFKKVNRVRGGQVQRRHKVSTRKGYTFRNGKLVRMKASEKRKRSLSQKKGARKRKGKQATSLRKRKISLRKSNRLN